MAKLRKIVLLMIVLSAFGVFLPVTVKGDFEGPYALTPPPPGQYTALAGAPTQPTFGDWMTIMNSGSLSIDTSAAPEALVLSWFRGNARISFKALASGTVRFDYTIAGEGAAKSFGWFHTTDPAMAPDFLTTNLASSPVSVSFEVEAGEWVGFFCSGSFDPGHRTVTISNFSGPEVVPQIIFTEDLLGYRVGEGESVTLSVATAGRNVPEPISYQWERNGVLVPDATNQTFLVTAGSGGTKETYRVLAKSGTVEAESKTADVVAVSSSEARLLLHLDFEQPESGAVVGTVRRVPGRVGSFAAELSGEGYIEVAAAGSDLELVGTTYTIAWWLKAGDAGGQIFTLGNPRGKTGYGSYSGVVVLWTQHRNEQAAPLETDLLADWQHIAIVYNGQTRTTFINGVARESVATTAPLIGSGRDNLLIGAESTDVWSARGMLDDFRIYNYPLASSEIAALANVAPMPRLAIDSTSKNVTLGWSADLGSKYRIEYASSLGQAAGWTPVTALIENIDGQYQVSQPATNAVRFYRLRAL
jgi:hypothetical protein